ncbi:MAG TPA: pyruvate dehydrogenase (acetyl-transferring), homodimeric type, partial [Pirellulales bacterium]
YYSMFGFQRVGDQIWAAADLRCRGFLLGGTAGRTTLNGEGLQHEDGHSHLLASTVPNLMAYDPTYAYETAAIVLDGIRRMYTEQEDVLYYITVHNENYAMPAMPEGAFDGIVKGLYKLNYVDAGQGGPKVHLFGSGSILREVLRGQQILAEKYGISSQVWSATSYKCLARDCEDVQRWNLLHPGETPRQSYLEQVLAAEGPADLVVSSSDNVRAVASMIAQHVPMDYYVLGTDGFGRSETRENLRRFFEVDAEHVVLATLHRLAKQGKIDSQIPVRAVSELGINPDLPNPVTR